jgi:hypothetical protein
MIGRNISTRNVEGMMILYKTLVRLIPTEILGAQLPLAPLSYGPVTIVVIVVGSNPMRIKLFSKTLSNINFNIDLIQIYKLTHLTMFNKNKNKNIIIKLLKIRIKKI